MGVRAKCCSVAVVLQVEDVAGFVAALLHDASLHHHLHLVLEGELGRVVLTACGCGSTRLRREETWWSKHTEYKAVQHKLIKKCIKLYYQYG